MIRERKISIIIRKIVKLEFLLKNSIPWLSRKRRHEEATPKHIRELQLQGINVEP